MATTKLQSIEREVEMCRKAFKGVKVGAIVQHCHHEQWMEILTEQPENRIAYILSDKPPDERAARLRCFRPLKPAQYRKLPTKLRRADAAWQQADAARQQAYAARQQAYAAWQQAYAARQQADAARQQADAARQQAYAAWQQADAARQQAYAAWQQADAFHKEICGCKWSKKTNIFGEVRA